MNQVVYVKFDLHGLHVTRKETLPACEELTHTGGAHEETQGCWQWSSRQT